jgi:hypothetical protein
VPWSVIVIFTFDSAQSRVWMDHNTICICVCVCIVGSMRDACYYQHTVSQKARQNHSPNTNTPPTLRKAFGHRDRLACCKSYLSAAS